ncbi:MAG TPA: alpha/beta fold hydrolase [Candidatus Limnocylindrales bacterium]|nr:alpha/beta fold hydrolase [Candidatus Limnocylindrales bacterium]
MKKLWVLFSLLLAVSTAQITVAQTPANGALLDAEFVATHSASEISQLIANFYEPDQVIPAQFAVDEYRIRFQSTYKDDEPIVIVAQFFVPRAEEATNFPVFIAGAGSSGIADQCAPTLEQPAVQNWGSYKLWMLSMATQGYITALPDYAGFNDPDRMQPYYVAEMAGRVMLDAGRAALNWSAENPDSPAQAQPAVLLAGYSQGGQTVFAAKDIWETYAPELPLKGIIGFAPVSNMASHMMTLPQLAPYRMVAWEDYYGTDQVDPARVFTDRWLPTLYEDVMRMCVFDAAGFFSANPAELYHPDVLEGLQNGTLDETYPTLAALLELNSPGFVPNDLPALIVQGTEDRTIPMDVHEAFVERYCAAGNWLNEQIHEGANHFHLREISYRETLDWMARTLAGDIDPNTCETRQPAG